MAATTEEETVTTTEETQVQEVKVEQKIEEEAAPAPAAEESAPAPAAEESAPAPAEEEAAPAPAVEESAPAPAEEEAAPAPAVEESAPAPAEEEAAPAPAAEESAPAPAEEEAAPAPAAEESAPAPAEEEAAPAVEQEAAPAPAEETTTAAVAPVEEETQDKENDEAVAAQIDPSLLMDMVQEPTTKRAAKENCPIAHEMKPKSRKRRKSLTRNMGITPDVVEAVAEVRKHDDSINVVLFEAVKTNNRKFTMTHAWTSGDGLTALKEELQYRFAQRCFAILRVQTRDDHGHEGDKFVYIRFFTDECPVMLKAKITPYIGQIDAVVGHHCMTIAADENFQEEITPEIISKEIVRLAGSDKPHWIYFGDGHTWDVRQNKYA